MGWRSHGPTALLAAVHVAHAAELLFLQCHLYLVMLLCRGWPRSPLVLRFTQTLCLAPLWEDKAGA